MPDGQILLYTTGGGGISLYRSAEGLSFTEISATTPQGSDPTVVATTDGRYRMYYVDHLDNTIKTAISGDTINFTNEGNTGIQNSTGTQAWGMPDTVVLPDGRVSESTGSISPGKAPQKLYIGTSTDGLNWDIEESPAVTLPDGGSALDPTAIKLVDGSYRIYFSATRGSNPFGDFYLTRGVLSRIK